MLHRPLPTVCLAACLAACTLLAVGAHAQTPDGFPDGIVFIETESDIEGGVEVLSVSVSERCTSALVRLPYLDIHGEPAAVQARIKARTDRLASGQPLPAFCHVYYEPFIDDIPGPDYWCDQGWVVARPHYPPDGQPADPEALGIANGVNHTRALIQWVRRLPFVDRRRIHLNGASQAGYMTLAAAASSFPVASASAFYPVVNWSYNLRYFEANQSACGYPDTPPAEGPMPVFAHISAIIDLPKPVFGDDFSSDAYYRVSPVACVDRITCPTLVVCATGDMLVPPAQMHPEREVPPPPEAFPEGYVRDFAALTEGSPADRPFEDFLDPSAFWTTRVTPSDGTAEVARDEVLGRAAPPPRDYIPYAELPWSDKHQWSLLYLDEGPPRPHVGHTALYWRVTFEAFLAEQHRNPLRLELLTVPKLTEIMERYTGECLDPPVALADGAPLNRRNFDSLERRDVLTGLIDYADAGPARAERLADCYAALPDRLKAFGPSISTPALAEQLERLTASTK